MPNVVINTVCNLKCRYCFADDCKANNVNQNMTISDFKKVLEFVTRTDNYIGILGGEPLIHPMFDDIVMAAIMNDRIMNMSIFTNGIEVDNHLGIFANRKVGTLINFNSEENIENKENEERVIENIGKLIELKKNQNVNVPVPENQDPNAPKYNPGDEINMGCNIYKEDQDFSVLIDTLAKYGKHRLRMSTVVPNSQDKRGINPIEYFLRMKPTVMRLFDMLYEIECVPNSDCNYIPLCLYSKEEIEMLNNKFIPIAQKYHMDFNITQHRTCHVGPMDIYPDLTVARCFGYSEHDRQSIEKYNNMNEIRNYFIRTVDNLNYYCAPIKDCLECHAFKTMQCSSGCMSYKAGQIEKIRKVVDPVIYYKDRENSESEETTQEAASTVENNNDGTNESN